MKLWRKIAIAADCLLILLTLIFIFGNSAQNVEESTNASDTVTEIVEEIPPVKEALREEKITHGEVSEFVRSLAHAAEFCLLGAEFMSLVILLGITPLVLSVFIPLFACLALGVFDESLQMLNDRSAEVVDIIKDFGGAGCGIFGVLAVYGIICLTKKRKKG